MHSCGAHTLSEWGCGLREQPIPVVSEWGLQAPYHPWQQAANYYVPSSGTVFRDELRQLLFTSIHASLVLNGDRDKRHKMISVPDTHMYFPLYFLFSSNSSFLAKRHILRQYYLLKACRAAPVIMVGDQGYDRGTALVVRQSGGASEKDR